MPHHPSKRALLIAGPTASGKSAIALARAREEGGVIINADSMQVYGELRILTARPSADEEAQAPHRLYGHVQGQEDYSVARWLAEAKMEMERCWREGVLPIVCGGTGLYFMALEEGLSQVPGIPATVREKWRSFEGDLHAELVHRDPAMAARLMPTDHQRIIRALEVVDATGHSLSHWQDTRHGADFLNDVNVERFLVEVPREELYARAERRLEVMVEAGALDEMRNLPPLAPDRPVMKAIGVPEFSSHLRGETSLDEAVAKAKTATRHYIKRQLTWWRNREGWSPMAP
jgi:tRNA dimethylallyltransferase